MLNDANLASEVARLAGRLPPFPAVVLQLLDMLRDDSTTLEVLARMVRNDPVISANILAYANHVRRLHAQSDLTDAFVAASIIGVNRVRSIVMRTGVNRFVTSVPGGQFLFQHSLAVAIAAQELAEFAGEPPDLAYIAGMLHDVGQVCLNMIDARAFEQVYLAAAADGRLVQREAAVFGADHCAVGAELSRYWKLPAVIHSAILNHHDEATVTCPLQAAICLAETLARALDLPSSPKNRVTLINQEAMAALGLDWSDSDMVERFDRCVVRFRTALQATEAAA